MRDSVLIARDFFSALYLDDESRSSDDQSATPGLRCGHSPGQGQVVVQTRHAQHQSVGFARHVSKFQIETIRKTKLYRCPECGHRFDLQL